MAYDSKANQVILYGGETGDYKLESSYNGETWAYDVATNTWKEMKPVTSPGPRAFAALAYDAESDRIILFSGGTRAHRWVTDDTWAYDFNTNTWTQMKAKGPTGIMGMPMEFDSESDRIILFGGYNVPGDKLYQDTWAYDYNTDTWTKMDPKTIPPGRNLNAMTYDSQTDRIIMWGGDTWTYSNPNAPKDDSVWAYDYNSDAWEEMKAVPAPADRPAGTISYDAKAGVTILYGGFEEGNSDTWAYDYNKNAWILLKPTNNPGMLTWHSMVYISATDRVFLFGGAINSIPNNKTWLYDYNANTWTEVTPKP
jgi:N-acetylneuraminic acid mutarotase